MPGVGPMELFLLLVAGACVFAVNKLVEK